MSKISKEASKALMSLTEWRQDNTRVTVQGGMATMYLHGNAIAEYDGQTLRVSFAGWVTRTTCERLNSLPNVTARIKGGEPLVNGVIVDAYDWETI